MKLVRSAALALAACGLVGPDAGAQQANARMASASTVRAARPDSALVLRGARAAQASFERTRYRNLPWTESRGGGGSCDERIGRFCIYHDDTETDWTPPPEPEAVKRARAALVAALDRAAAATPGDAWIAGQRVRYLVQS
ncbi:MAG TPA: hypothetical protein VM890_16885, partial [Longimicrobium sp.]|nr:hypothetical protein [Longimicrobium sp.]